MNRAPRFVVYGIDSTCEMASFYHVHHALARAAKLNAREDRYGEHGLRYGVCRVGEYHSRVVHMVERINYMSGKKYIELSNTPHYCSPSSETYWSM